jgi:hypothetical protein
MASGQSKAPDELSAEWFAKEIEEFAPQTEDCRKERARLFHDLRALTNHRHAATAGARGDGFDLYAFVLGAIWHGYALLRSPLEKHDHARRKTGTEKYWEQPSVDTQNRPVMDT